MAAPGVKKGVLTTWAPRNGATDALPIAASAFFDPGWRQRQQNQAVSSDLWSLETVFYQGN